VPIPAELVSLCRTHLETFGTGDGGAMFRNERGGLAVAQQRRAPTEVARRLGHDVAVLLKIYSNCIDGQEGEINDRITAALTAHHDHETLPPAPAVDTAAQTKPADQSQDGRLWTPQDRRSALVAQGIEHRFPKALAVRCRRSPITPQQPAKTPVTQGRSLCRTRLASARTSVTICHCQAPSATVRGTDAA
jgi:hypothetical protein